MNINKLKRVIYIVLICMVYCMTSPPLRPRCRLPKNISNNPACNVDYVCWYPRRGRPLRGYRSIRLENGNLYLEQILIHLVFLTAEDL